jgi:hypothetical protein
MPTTTNNRLLISESHNNSNWCTPYSENLIHTTRTLLTLLHVCHMYAFHGQSPYVAIFHAHPTESADSLLPRKRAPDSTSQPIWVTHGVESASRPPSGFWCLIDKMIKDLMTFAKCETGKMSYKLHWDHSLFETYVMAMMITYLCMP